MTGEVALQSPLCQALRREWVELGHTKEVNYGLGCGSVTSSRSSIEVSPLRSLPFPNTRGVGGAWIESGKGAPRLLGIVPGYRALSTTEPSQPHVFLVFLIESLTVNPG